MRKFGAGFFLICLCVLFGVPGVCVGQVFDVQLVVEPNEVGLGRYVQPGVWTPMRVTLLNQSAAARNVTTRWIIPDEDGDLVLSQRTVVLTPGVTQQHWLYADVPTTHRPNNFWQVQVLDDATGRLLAKQSVSAPEQLSVFQSAIGVCATTDLGLGDYEPGYSQHESVKFIRGLQLSTLPDRWYGLSMLRTLIWTYEGSDPLNDPSDASVTPEIVDALRKWVERGGHLVISMPMIGQTWSDSPWADLMPVGKNQMQVVADFDPILLGPLRGDDTHEPMQAMVFDVGEKEISQGVAVLATDRQRRPYIVAKRFGFGRVTLIGIDLARPAVRRRGLPSGRIRLWNTVFHWNAPLVAEREYEGETRNIKMVRVRDHDVVSLDKNMPLLVAMTGQAAVALFLAILVFGLYWLLAGPVAYVVLKRRGLVHHSWLAFVMLGGVFTVLAWGGAWIMRPAHTAIEHVSILDIDARTGTVHTRSWLSLLVPKFGQAEVAIDGENMFEGHWLASPGFESRLESGGRYLDPQSYEQNAANPRRLVIPVRSTAKRFAVDYMGRLDVPMAGLSEPWVLPQSNVRISRGWPVGELTHNLPGELKNVLIIFCPGTTTLSGDLQMPWVGYQATWPAQKTLTLEPPPAMQYERLVQPLSFYKAKGISLTFYGDKRLWDNEHYLGRVIGAQRGASQVQQTPAMVKLVDNRLMQQLQLLSFYDALPPPSFRDMSGMTTMTGPTFYRRSLMRHIDITPLIAGRRLIVIGQLENSPLPAPLTLDGNSVPAKGLTLVRWIYDL